MPAAAVAVIAAVIFGCADFLGGLAAKRMRAVTATAIAAISGMLLIAVLAPALGGAWRLDDILWGALAGLFSVVAIVLLYACLAIGPMSILSPLTAVVSAIAPMLWGLVVNDEALTPLGYIGLAVALVAVVLVGFIPGEKAVRPSMRGILMAVGSGLAIGGFMVCMDHTAADSGLTPLLANRAVIVVITWIIVGALVVGARRGAVEASVAVTPTGHADLEHHREYRIAGAMRTGVWLALACGIVDALANVLILVALRLGDLAIVSVLTAMYPAGTIILAALVLRERISSVQWLGLALALTAGAMFALA